MAYSALSLKSQKPRPHEPVGFTVARWLLRALIQKVDLSIACPDYKLFLRVGKRGYRRFSLTIDRPELLWELMRNPDPGLGETFMQGRWSIQEGDLGEFLTMLARCRQQFLEGPGGALFFTFFNARPEDYSHTPQDDRKQVRHHYDLGNDLYESFLDEGLNYSCAFFDRSGMSLRDAQLHKIRTAIRRLDIRPGMRVLDVGCGWGETARIIAAETGAREVNGITLAKNQYRAAQEKAAAQGNPARYFLEDYREHSLRYRNYYDRIISIGMFEHVGTENWGVYFHTLARQLKPGGKALVHSIVRSGHPATHELSSPWLNDYIFPGGCLGEIEDMIEAGEQAGLIPPQAPYIHESFHYAETLRRWRSNFTDNLKNLDPKKYDPRFQRMWFYYLAMCEAMFDGCGYRVAQFVFRKP